MIRRFQTGKLEYMNMRCYIAVLLLLVTGSVCAQDQEELERWYDVEIIVIQNLDFERNNTETWPPTGRLPDYTNSRDLFAPPEDQLDEIDDSALDENNSETAVTAGISNDTPASENGFVYPEPFNIPAEEELSLRNALSSLKRSRNFRPLLHLAWTQPPLERQDAEAVRIYIPAEPTDDAEQPGTQDTKTTVFSDNTSLLENDELEPVNAENIDSEFLPESWFDPTNIDLRRPLDGTITLVVSRYLHLYLDVVFLPEEINVADQGEFSVESDQDSLHDNLTRLLAEGEITLEEARAQMNASKKRDFYGFKLDQSRRMRNGEVHYFDHPAFSIIAVVTPRDFELPESTEPLSDATALQQTN